MICRVKVVLHGKFKDLLDDQVILTGRTVAEIINGLCKVTNVLNPDPIHGKQVIRVLGCNSPEDIYKPFDCEEKELHIAPAMLGGKSKWVQIGIAVAMIALAVWNPAFLTFTVGNLQVSLASTLFWVGATTLLGGIMGLMSPSPVDNNDPESSKYLGAPGNTVRIGTPIPIIYGKRKAYGHYISFDIDAKDVSV